MTLVVFTFTAIRVLKHIEFVHFQGEKTSVVKTYYQKLRESLQASTDIAYRYYEEAYTYADLNKAMQQINAVINSYQNKSIVLYSHKSFESYAAVYASILSGNIWVPLSPSLPVDAWEYNSVGPLVQQAAAWTYPGRWCLLWVWVLEEVLASVHTC